MNRKWLRLMVCVLLIASMLIAPMNAMAASSTKVIQLLKVTADGARVRKGPSSAYDVITSIRKGEALFYLGKTSGAFCRVRTSTGQIGYMYKGFLKSYGAVQLRQIYYSKADGVRVYKRASTRSSRVTSLSKKQHVIVYQTKGNWAYVKTLSGKGGFVRLSSLKKAS